MRNDSCMNRFSDSNNLGLKIHPNHYFELNTFSKPSTAAVPFTKASFSGNSFF